MSFVRTVREAWRTKRWLRLVGDGALLILVVVAISWWQTRHHARGDATPFSLRSLDGATVSTADLAGRPTLLVFWAPWCRVCHANAAAVERVSRWFDESARVVSVASEYQSVEEVRATAAREGWPAPVLLGGNRVAREWGVQAFPTFFFLDERGRVHASAAGYTSTVGLAARLFVDP